ncbi:MAG TPA: helix-turn-helix transcriptional regulator [Candidatus Tumulicola sp.]
MTDDPERREPDRPETEAPKDAAAGWNGLGSFIRAQRELANLSMRQLAEIAKISNPYLSQVERGLYKPSADVLKQIAGALHLSAETMYVQAGLLDDTAQPDGAGRDTEAAIRLDPKLSVDQKDTLIRIYRSFLGLTP